MPRAPQSRSGRYEDLAAAELADVVERAYEHDELPDWELIFELTRRATTSEDQSEERGFLGASRPS